MNASQSDIENACEFAAASEFINKLPLKNMRQLLVKMAFVYLVDRNKESQLQEQFLKNHQ